MPKISITLPPITILNATPTPVPVTLAPLSVNNLWLLAAKYSDDSYKVLSGNDNNDVYTSSEDGEIVFAAKDDCRDTSLTIDSGYPRQAGYEVVPFAAYINSCALSGDNELSGELIIEVDGVTFKISDWFHIAGESIIAYTEDFELQTS